MTSDQATATEQRCLEYPDLVLPRARCDLSTGRHRHIPTSQRPLEDDE